MKKLAILIDSGSTVDQSFNNQNDIFVIPLSLSDKNNKVYLDRPEEITPEFLFSENEKGNEFKTSCTALGVLLMKVEELLSEYENVIMIPISEGLSGQFNVARNVADEFPGKFFVVKSTSGAYPLEYISKQIRAYAQENPSMPMDKIVEWGNTLFTTTATYFSCEDPTGLAKSGRASKAIVKVFEVLKLKPLVCLEFKNHLAGVGKNYKTITEKMIKAIRKDFGKNELLKPGFIKSVCLYLGGYDDEKKQYLLSEIEKNFKIAKDKVLQRWVPTCVLAHTKKGSYGITVCCEKPFNHREHQD